MYALVSSSACDAAEMLSTAARSRSRCRPDASWWKPRFSSPKRFDAGTRASSNTISAVSDDSIPVLSSFLVTVSPGVSRSTSIWESWR